MKSICKCISSEGFWMQHSNFELKSEANIQKWKKQIWEKVICNSLSIPFQLLQLIVRCMLRCAKVNGLFVNSFENKQKSAHPQIFQSVTQVW